jgi:tRNA (adenine22-N1)-methyltransferase
MQLTLRLAEMARRVPQGCRLADVGTDHARLPIWLLRNGRVSQVIASDLRKGPLEQASRNAAKYQVADQLELRLCSGLANIQPEEVDTITICGMGGETIQSILEAAPWTKEKLLLLQPQSNWANLRRFLQENGYAITGEGLCQDRQRFYTILTVRGGQMPPLTTGEAYVGRFADWEPDPRWPDYLNEIITKMEQELQLMGDSQQERDVLRRADYESALPELKARMEALL